MKKGRPGVLLQVQCRAELAEVLANIIFSQTSTLGLRRSELSRIILPRETISLSTPFGQVSGVAATLPGGSLRFSPEYDSCCEIADKNQVPLAEVMQAARQAFADQVT